MDNLIQKFYSNGKEEEQKYTQFGAFSNSLMKNSATKFNFKPNIQLINPAIHNVESTSQNQIPKTPVKNIISDDAYLKPKKLIFNSSSDLFNQNIPKNNFAYSTKNENGLEKESIPSLKTIKQDINTENKKNSTKMQMMEEKMKNLELKSQRLEVINDFFFDMFENNLVKEELKRQKGIKEEKEDKEEENFTENLEERKDKKEYQKKKKQKKKKKELIKNPQFANDEESYMNQFIERTDKISRKYLDNIKTDIGLFLMEHQLKKNDAINNITVDILDLQGELMNKLNSLEMKQKAEMKTIAYCLQNSGDDNVENLATRLFADDLLKQDEDISNFNTYKNSMNTTALKTTRSAFNNDNLFSTKFHPRKQLNERNSSIDKIRQSIDTNINNDQRNSKFQFKEEENKIRTRSPSIFKKANGNEIIIEENDDE